MDAIVLRCRAGYRFHFGLYAPDADTALNDTSAIIHSDTLFAAIVTTYNDVFEDTNDFVGAFETGEIKISSCYFCFKQLNKWIWFLPKPVSFNLAQVEDYKSYRKLSYISKKLWENIETPEELTSRNDVVVLQGTHALLKEELALKNDASWNYLEVYKVDTLPKVHVRKETMEDSLYQLSLVEIADNREFADNLETHYYFLTELSDSFKERFGQRFTMVLEILGQSGIGGERSTVGKLDGVEIIQNWEMPASDSDYCCTLSLLLPIEDDFNKLLFYQSMFRGGRRIGSYNGRSIQKSLRMITEGAVVMNDISGKISDVSPETSEKIYKRNGIPLTIPVPQSWLPVPQ